MTTTLIELEEFDKVSEGSSGQGFAYFDNEAGNKSSTTFRPEQDVDAFLELRSSCLLYP